MSGPEIQLLSNQRIDLIYVAWLPIFNLLKYLAAINADGVLVSKRVIPNCSIHIFQSDSDSFSSTT